ncbi:MAG TPA: ABC transporter permease [Chloroflexota bacterium]|nr:ABC transporter permease [Chloroflexota bacterium]
MKALQLPVASGSVARRRWLRRNAWPALVYVLLAVIVLAQRIAHPNYGAFEIQSAVIGAMPFTLATLGQTCAVLAGGIDLAVGTELALFNVIAATLMANAGFGESLLIGLLVLVMGFVVGALTGAVINVTGVPDIIVTLATSFVFAGLALLIMPIAGSGGAPTEFGTLFTGELSDVWPWTGAVGSVIPAGLLSLAFALLVIWLPFRRSRASLALYALGSNRTAAFLSGVSVNRTRILAYGLTGTFAALGGLALTGTTGSGDPNIGISYTLNSVAAVVLGGVSLTGGRGGMAGPIAAAFSLYGLLILLQFLGISVDYQYVVQGVTLVIVVLFLGRLWIGKR